MDVVDVKVDVNLGTIDNLTAAQLRSLIRAQCSNTVVDFPGGINRASSDSSVKDQHCQ